MCGRYTLIEADKLTERFKAITTIDSLKPNYNAAPTQTMPIVVAGKDANQVELMQWGLIPSWSKEPKMKFSTINARAEGLEDKPTYRGPFKRSRCIVPADGFYEWQKNGSTKTPYFIHLKNSELYGFAGLFDTWHSPDGSELRTYTIVTTKANQLMEPIHERMPVILEKQHEDPWLDPSIDDVHLLHSFLKPYNTDKMEAYPVSQNVNAVKNNTRDLTASINSK